MVLQIARGTLNDEFTAASYRRVPGRTHCESALAVWRPSWRIASWKRFLAGLIHIILRFFLGFGGIRRSTLIGLRRLLLTLVWWAFHL